MTSRNSTTSPSLLFMCVMSRLSVNSNDAIPSKHFFRCGWTLAEKKHHGTAETLVSGWMILFICHHRCATGIDRYTFLKPTANNKARKKMIIAEKRILNLLQTLWDLSSQTESQAAHRWTGRKILGSIVAFSPDNHSNPVNIQRTNTFISILKDRKFYITVFV